MGLSHANGCKAEAVWKLEDQQAEEALQSHSNKHVGHMLLAKFYGPRAPYLLCRMVVEPLNQFAYQNSSTCWVKRAASTFAACLSLGIHFVWEACYVGLCLLLAMSSRSQPAAF